MKSNDELLRGLQSLVEVAIDQGMSAAERVHLATSARTFTVLEAIPVVSEPAALVRAVHDGIVKVQYRLGRGVNRLVGGALRIALDVAASARAPEALPPAPEAT